MRVASSAGRSLTGVRSFRGWRALGYRNFRLLFIGQVVSLVGTFMQQTAQGWLVLVLTNDPFALGLVTAAQFAPILVFGLFGGVLADQLPKRTVMLWTQATSMVFAFVLFALTITGTVEVWHVFVLAALLGIANAVDMPTRLAFAAEMVPAADVPNVVALNSLMFNSARVVGPAVAGLVIGLLNLGSAFLINGLSYLAVIAALWLMRLSEMRYVEPGVRPASVRALFSTVADGLRYVRRTEVVLVAVVVVGLASLFGMNFPVLVPALARDVLGSDAAGFGVLMSAVGLGSLFASFGLIYARRVSPLPIALGAMLLGVASLVASVSTEFPLTALAMFAAGLGGIGMAATANTTIQSVVPDALRGRVISVYTTVFAGSVPIGGLLMGAVASAWGVVAALWVAGLASVAVGGAGVWWLRSTGRRRNG